MSELSGTPSPFGRDSTAAVLRVACDNVGVDSTGAELLRLGENAIYRLFSEPLVVRIARRMDHWASAVKEVAVSGWLAGQGLPAARIWDTPQPIEVEHHPVTFWHFIDGRRGAPGDVADLGSALRRLHRLSRPGHIDLPDEDILERVEPRIGRSAISAADREFLSELVHRLRDEIKALDFVLPEAVTHGDAHVQNLMVRGDEVILIDFERVAFGHPEWDLAMTATEYVTAGWWTDAQYAEFCDAYGFDVISWTGFDTLRRVHEIKMTTWLMQNVQESPDIAREFATRMRTIRGETTGERWKTF